MPSLYNRFYNTFIFDNRYLYFTDGLKMTVLLTLSSFLLGTILAVAFCFGRQSKNKVVKKVCDALCGLLVQLPTMVMLMVFVYIIFGSSGISIILIVIFGLTLKAGAYLGEIFLSAVRAVNSGEIEAARALGMTKAQAFFNITLSQAVTTAKPLYGNQLVSTMQETSVVGYLAIMDLTRASSVVASRTVDALFGLIIISIIYLLLGLIGRKVIALIGNKKHLGGER